MRQPGLRLSLLSAMVLCGLLLLGGHFALTPVRGQDAQATVAPTALATAPAASATPALPARATARIGAYGDASVVSGGLWAPDTNLGGWTELGVGQHGGGVFRSYLRFLTGGLPPGIQIDSARLVLNVVEAGSVPVDITANVVVSDWDEGSINWNQQPLSTWQTAEATWQPGSAAQFSFDLTPAARMWYACGGASNDGVVLSADLSSGWVAFGSRKSDTPPVLEVTYEASAAAADCAAPPSSPSVGSPPQAPAPSTSGAQIGSTNPVTVPIVTPIPTPTQCPLICIITSGAIPAATMPPPVSSAGGASSGGSSSGGSSGGSAATPVTSGTTKAP